MRMVFIVMYQVGWDNLEAIEAVFDSEEKADDYINSKPQKSRYSIDDRIVE